MAAVKVLDHKYEILSEIKRGGFGVVYLGRDRLFDKPVAIKAISPELLGEAKYLDLFQAESLAVARLNHHNIIRIYDIKREEEGQFYIIMEYIDGLDLRQLINAARKDRHLLPPHLSAYIIAEACAGLDYAHTRRDPDTHQPLHLIHQDISPGNIMINQLGEVKIIDFGLANARRRPAKAGEKGEGKNEVLIQGKLGYLAPEQVLNNGPLDHRLDIFALGAVFYEMLTGQRLFKENSPSATVQNLRAGSWDLALLKATDTPEPLVRVVERALQKEPRQRFQSANQIYVELMNFLASREPALDYALELGTLVQRLAPSRSPAALHEAPAAQPPVITVPAFEDNFAGSVPQEDFTIAEAEMVLNLDESKLHFNSETLAEKFEHTPALPFEVEVPPQAEPEPHHTDAAPMPQEGAFYKVIAEEEEENEARTIIDVVRLSARTHRKAILRTLAGTCAALILFVIGDVWGQWTSFGTGIYDLIFPPAIKIVSFPSGAQVYLDDEPLPKTTPLAIEKISPGVHKLTLTLPRFESIVRSIQVPSQGSITVAEERQPEADQPYVFRFKTILEITSKPEGAEVYLNGAKYAQATPCRVLYEVSSEPLHIELRKDGLMTLGGFNLNTISGAETIEDRRLWRFDRIEGQREHFTIIGTFVKPVTINSTPSLAEIFVDDDANPVGLTGYATELLLTIGTHKITLQKENFLPRTFALEIDENSPSEYNETLSRLVRIFAKNANSASDDDIKAQVTEIIHGGRSTKIKATTPCELTLLPYPYKIILSKPGLADYVLTIPATSNVAIARMSAGSIMTEITVLDERSGRALNNVEISYQAAARASEPETFFGETDESGIAERSLPPGEYRFRVKKLGYGMSVKQVQVDDDRRRIVFKLAASK